MTPADPNQDRIPLFRKIPQYPFSELEDANEGYASFEFDIDESGFVRNIKLLEKEGGNFDMAAMKALEKWRYAPSFENGKPVVTNNVQTIIRFDLED